jgi:hypothetical protein
MNTMPTPPSAAFMRAAQMREVLAPIAIEIVVVLLGIIAGVIIIKEIM